jgi:hypothetical protein
MGDTMRRRLGRLAGALALCAASALLAPNAAAQRESHTPPRSTRRDVLFVTAAITAAAANSVMHYHHAAGTAPRESEPNDRWIAPDKALHGGASFALTLAGINVGVRPWVASAGICGAGAVFEATQVRASPKDMAVNCAGAALAWGTSKLLHRRPAQSASRPR